jgi:CRISPR/Cas system CMR subunit Cmr4 (Cas7 group RAMP superfamily)
MVRGLVVASSIYRLHGKWPPITLTYPVPVWKGAPRDKADRPMKNGQADTAGDLLAADARILLLPVRSLTRSYRWLTCPHIIERLRRDMRRAGFASKAGIPKPDNGTVHTVSTGKIYLEERQFAIKNGPDAGLIADLGQLNAHDSTRARLEETAAIVDDDSKSRRRGYRVIGMFGDGFTLADDGRHFITTDTYR